MTNLDRLRRDGTKALAGIAVLSALALGVLALAWGNYLYAGLAAAITLVPLAVAMSAHSSAGARLLMGATVPFYAMIAVALTEGQTWQIDMHMLFFAYLATLALLADARVILAGAGLIAVHHLGLNFLAPALVFSDGANLLRVVFHAVVVVVETGALCFLCIRLEALLVEVTNTRNEHEALQAQREEEQRKSIAQQSETIEILTNGLAKLAEGDFTHRVNLSASDSTGGNTGSNMAAKALSEAYNSSAARLAQTIEEVRGSAQSVSTSSNEITDASSDLANRNEQQAASLEETAAATAQATVMVKQTADNASNAQSAMDQTNERAQRGGEVVREAINAMSSIESSSQEISEIIGVIDGIAFQTNLLALNAGVEAARAGEAGKGFAVVASEVRELAQRSADAANNIKELISNSGARVTEGVNLVNQTGDLLTQIAEHLEAMNTQVSDITSMAANQATNLEQVNSSVGTIDHMTQQNAAMVEQTSAAARSLSGEASRLAAMVSRFKTNTSDGDNDGAIQHTRQETSLAA